jgi:PAS domain S-box-containing protein
MTAEKPLPPRLAAVPWMLTLLVTSLMLLPAAAAGAPDDNAAETPTAHAFLGTLSGDERAWLRDHPVIRVVQDPDWPPIEFVNERGEPSGMSADYLGLVEERLGVKFERVRGLTWQEAYARLKHREIDMTTCVAVTPEREVFWAFTKPYLNIPVVIATRPDVTYISDMRELAGKKVAVVEGYAVTEWIPRDYPEIELVRVETVQEGLKLLQRGEVFAYIDNLLIIGHYQARTQVTNIKIAGQTPYVNAQSMAVRKDWAPLAGILQKALDSIPEKERADIYSRWLPIRFEHGFDYTRLWQALAVFGAILLGLVLWIWKLGREISKRKRVEAALVENERKYRELVENANSIILRWGRDGRIIFLNEFGQRFFGYTEAEIVRRHVIGTIVPETENGGRSLNTLMEEICADPAAFEQNVNQNMRRNGQRVWIAWTNKVVLDPQGQVVEILSIGSDITDRKQAEESEHLAHERLRRFIDANIVGVIIARTDGSLLEANDYYLHLIGYTREELDQGQVDWRAITPPEWLPADNQAIREMRERGTCTPYEKEYVRRDGTRVSIFLVDALLPGPEEQIAAFILDVTRRKRAEDELRRTNRALQTLSDCNQALVRATSEQELLEAVCRYIVDTGGYRMAWIGYAEQDEARSVRPVAHAGFEDGYLDALNITWADEERGRGPTGTALRTGQPQVCRNIQEEAAFAPWREQANLRGYRSSISLPLSDGQRVFGALNLYADQPNAFDENELTLLQELAGDLAFGVTALRMQAEHTKAEDTLHQAHATLEQRVQERTTELAAALEQARQADRVKSSFLASMSHELRTPLNSIIGFTGILLQGLAGPLNPEQGKQLGMVQSSSRHLLSLINDVLDLSKIEAGRLTVERKPFPVSDAVDSVIGTLMPLARQKGLTLEAHGAEEVGELVSDQRRVEQVLINLVGNAVKFTAQGQVRLDCHVEDGGLVMRITDTGIGIRPQDMDKLFGLFQQIPEGQPRSGGGTGLGLAICKKLAEALGGSIEAESRWGVGSTFTFRLPLGVRETPS